MVNQAGQHTAVLRSLIAAGGTVPRSHVPTHLVVQMHACMRGAEGSTAVGDVLQLLMQRVRLEGEAGGWTCRCAH
jgi:hypothetical protein